MSVFTGFKSLLLVLPFVTWGQHQLVSRFGFFRAFPGILLSSEFVLKQFNNINQIACVKRCYFDKKCVSIAYGRLVCILFATDPRAQLNESSLIRTNNSPLTMYIVSTDLAIPCHVGNIAAYSDSDLKKCKFEEKSTDSRCFEWSEWNSVFHTTCDGNATFVQRRTHATNCTQPFFGGETANCSETWLKVPRFPQSQVTRLFNTATTICGDRGEDLFTGSVTVYLRIMEKLRKTKSED